MRARPHRHPAQAHREEKPAGEVTFGLRAGLALFARRPGDILRVAASRAVRAETTELARWAASRGVPFTEREDAELARLAETDLHEGLCILARPRRWAPIAELAGALARGGVGIALDRVRNPYNVGAVLRTAAFLGVDAAILGAPAPHPALAPAAVRVAEGGAEHLLLARTTDLAETLSRLRARGVRIVGADSHAPESAFAFSFPRPLALVVGNEREGLGERVRKECDAVVAIVGTGAVESLNVAVAAGLLMAEAVRAPR
jgi:RNA methyltransferase, TrmH family